MVAECGSSIPGRYSQGFRIPCVVRFMVLFFGYIKTINII